MDLDAAFDITSAFQLVPGVPRAAPEQLFEDIRGRGFEVNLHDFNHDGYLFHTRRHFQQRVSRLNDYGRRLGCRGFRSGAMYRQQHWYDELAFAYDMSVPNVAHLEPQRGGCCTVMPYFVGGLLELPLTTIQDYSLFHIVGDYSTKLWKEQIQIIRDHSGLVSILTHPDYLAEPEALAVYRELLEYLASLRSKGQLWIAPPGAINDWWRERRNMRVVRQGASWRVVGAGSERARVAFAHVEGDTVRFEVDGMGTTGIDPRSD
jgi:peptidoglycan/xylan/chitin deacetylase (PgdA/CDA1 family)